MHDTNPSYPVTKRIATEKDVLHPEARVRGGLHAGLDGGEAEWGHAIMGAGVVDWSETRPSLC